MVYILSLHCVSGDTFQDAVLVVIVFYLHFFSSMRIDATHHKVILVANNGRRFDFPVLILVSLTEICKQLVHNSVWFHRFFGSVW